MSSGSFRRRRKLRLIAAAATVTVVIAAALLGYFLPAKFFLTAVRFPAREEGELRLHFVDVGEGDCTIVEFPDGELLVIDAGDGNFEARNNLLRYIKGLRPARVEMLLTHADVDHYGGFSSLLENFGADRFYLPVLGSDAEEYRALLAAIGKAGCETQTLSRYDTIVRAGGAYLNCISPYSEGETDENDASAVLYLGYGDFRALLCGDISSSRERLLTREYSLAEGLFDSGDCTVRLEKIDVLKVAHHGSASSSSEEWLSLLEPKAAVVSCGRGNAYFHPSGEALERIRAASPEVCIYRTDELGNIIVSVGRGNVTFLTDWE